MSSEALPLMVDADVRARLEKLAAQADRSVSAVLRQFLDENDRFIADVQEGLAEADAGMLIDFEVVKADVESQLARLATKG